MREIFRAIAILFIICTFIFLFKKSVADSRQEIGMACIFFVGTGLAVYLFDFLMRRQFHGYLMSFVLGIIAGGILSWVTAIFISSLSFLAGFLDHWPWKPMLEIFLIFLMTVWISYLSSGHDLRIALFSAPDFHDKYFKRFHIFLIILFVLFLTVFGLSRLQTQWLWQGQPLAGWIMDLSKSGYDFQLHFEKSMNTPFLAVWTSLLLFLVLEWFWGRFCLPWMGLILMLSVFTGFLNYLFLDIGADSLYAWLSSDLLQFFILLNCVYLAVSWGLFFIERREFCLPFLKVEIK